MRCALLVEQHAVFRQAVAYLLARDLRVELVEEAATLAEARALALENLGSINVVVSELALPDGEATDFLAALREAQADVPVLVLTFLGDRPSRERVLELGAARVMGKDAPVEEIFAAIRKLGGLGDD
ncbi:MAG: response regulator transcription factor [Actinomycetota bacterium]|nr:response regulator transcription factor [Actinomycetota bacterium]